MSIETGKKYVGQFIPINDLSVSLACFASQDNQAAQILQDAGLFRPAAYHYHQMGEKLIKSKIIAITGNKSNHEALDFLKGHELMDAITVLLKILPGQPVLKHQILNQIRTKALRPLSYRYFATNTRYPVYSWKYNNFKEMHVGESDCKLLQECINGLVTYLNDFKYLEG
jgi:HEPN domain-containing protein